MKPTDYSMALAVKLIEMFGSQEAIPGELKSKMFMVHMRLQEAEQEIEYLMARAAAYRDAPVEPTIAGDETGEF